MRKKIIAGNWKMNKTSSEAADYLKVFLHGIKKSTGVEIILAPPFTLLSYMHDALRKTTVSLAAQDVYFEKSGAFTGEISPVMIKEFATYVIIGHSERRNLFSESNQTINKKIKSALAAGLKIIFCIGEKLEERNNGDTKKIIDSQVNLGLEGIDSINDIIFAYEPVWAIGTGKNATPTEAEEIHRFIRGLIEKRFSKKASESASIIYGGSVTPDNAKDLLKMPDIDGCLPGGASLDPEKLIKIIKSI